MKKKDKNSKRKNAVIFILLAVLVCLEYNFYTNYNYLEQTVTTELKKEELTTDETISLIVTTEELTETTTEETTTEESTTEESTTEESTTENSWQGEVLNPINGTVEGPSGKETYYNLNMSGVIRIMESSGYHYEYWIRDDGVKMYGEYIMCAANLNLRPRGTIIETSLGTAIVCDTGSFAKNNPKQLDIAVDW